LQLNEVGTDAGHTRSRSRAGRARLRPPDRKPRLPDRNGQPPSVA